MSLNVAHQAWLLREVIKIIWRSNRKKNMLNMVIIYIHQTLMKQMQSGLLKPILLPSKRSSLRHYDPYWRKLLYNWTMPSWLKMACKLQWRTSSMWWTHIRFLKGWQNSQQISVKYQWSTLWCNVWKWC